MRTIQLLYENLAEKHVGQRFALRDPKQLKHLQVIKAEFANYKYEFIDGKGFRVKALMKQRQDEGILFEVIEILEDASSLRASELAVKKVLFLPIIRQAALENAIELVTQLNLYAEIVIYFSDFTRYTTKEYSANKLQRLRKISAGAVGQSKSSLIPTVSLEPNLASAIAAQGGVENLHLIFPLSQKDTPAFSLSKLAKFMQIKKGTIALVIGAEGGFGPKEIVLSNQSKKSYQFYFGDSVLTSENAAAVFSGLVKLAAQ